MTRSRADASSRLFDRVTRAGTQSIRKPQTEECLCGKQIPASACTRGADRFASDISFTLVCNRLFRSLDIPIREASFLQLQSQFVPHRGA